MKKSKNKIILWIALVIILIVGLGVLSYFYNPFSQTVFPVKNQCYVISSATSPGSYSCQGTKCDAVVKSTCDTVVGTRNVKFRTNAITFDDYDKTTTWIVLPCIPSGDTCIATSTLNGYCATGSGASGSVGSGYFVRDTPTNNDIRVYNSKLYILSRYQDTAQTMRVYRLYTASCVTAEISTLPKYNCDNIHEICEGTNEIYKCSKDVFINNVKYTTISYSGSVKGEYNSDVIHLTNGQTLSSSGAEIDWAVIDDSRACSVSQCNGEKTGYYACSTGSCPTKSTTLTACDTGKTCFDSGSGASCSPPITSNVQFVDDNGEVTSGYAPGQTIYAKISVSSTKVSTANVAFVLIDSNSNPVSTVQTKTLDFSKTNNFKLDFSPLTTNGEYNLKVTYSYNNQETINKYPFTIANQIYINIVAYSEKTGSKLQVGDPITLELRTSSDVDGKNAVSATVIPTATATLNGNAVLIKSCTQETTGIYLCKVTANAAGTLSVRATAERFGYVTENTKTFGIETAEIFIDFLNIDKYKQGVDINSNNLIKYTTKNLASELIDTGNQIEILRPGQAVGIGTKITPSGSGGNYQFTFSPTSEEGGWTLIVRSSAVGYDNKESLPQIINVAPGVIPVECTTDDECSVSQICRNGTCSDITPPYWQYALIALGIIVGITIIILIIRFIRNKKTSKSVVEF